MFDARGLGEAERLIDEWRGTIEERSRRALELSARLARLTHTARSPDGLVTLTVGATGDLVRLDLGEGIRRQPAAVTAREIMSTLRLAQRAMVDAVRDTTSETVGADSATGRAIIETFAARFRPEDGCRD